MYVDRCVGNNSKLCYAMYIHVVKYKGVLF